LFFKEYEQKLNFNDEEDNKVLYLSALKLLSDINYVTNSINVGAFSHMSQIALECQAKLLFLLIGLTKKELHPEVNFNK
jgi:hypothetical protein